MNTNERNKILKSELNQLALLERNEKIKSDLSEFKNQHKGVEELRDKIQSSLIQSGIISDKKQITGSESGDSEWDSGTCPYADFDIEIDNKLYCIQVTDLTKDYEHYVCNLEKENE